MKDVYILSALRTPIGSFGGSLSELSATRLGGMVIKEAVARAGITGGQVQEVFMGNVLSASLGQAPATQAAKFAGLPDLPATTINKVCASGMKAVMLAAQGIASGYIDIAVAGGMESMSRVPYYLEKARSGYRLGHGQLTDGLLKDGLWDVYNDFHMAEAAEICACNYDISRQQQDTFAIESYRRAQAACNAGYFRNELIEIEVPGKKGEPVVVAADEEPFNVKFDKIQTLKPVFREGGTVTAANASTLNDGAAAMVLAGADTVKALDLRPLARIVSFSDAQLAPEKFTTAPAQAIPKALERAGINGADVDFYEINEAFAVVALANNQELGLDANRVNVFGGAVSLGHPIGASGARIIVTLINVLKQHSKRIGVASICNGGGGASAIVIENL